MIPGFTKDLDENVDGNLDKDLDQNLLWLTQKTEDPKSNKRNLTYSPYTVNVIEWNCKVYKESSNPPISTSTRPPFQVYPPFLGNNFVPPSSDSIFGSSYPPPPLIRGVGWGATMSCR